MPPRRRPVALGVGGGGSLLCLYGKMWTVKCNETKKTKTKDNYCKMQ